MFDLGNLQRGPAMPEIHHASCNCGAVKLTMNGKPKRVGVCHCQTCKRATGSPFAVIAVWKRPDVTISGDTKAWKATSYDRHFCSVCGSSVFGTEDGDQTEIEVNVGVIAAAPSAFTPTYELWVERREHWLEPVAGAAQFEGNRPT